MTVLLSIINLITIIALSAGFTYFFDRFFIGYNIWERWYADYNVTSHIVDISDLVSVCKDGDNYAIVILLSIIGTIVIYILYVLVFPTAIEHFSYTIARNVDNFMLSALPIIITTVSMVGFYIYLGVSYNPQLYANYEKELLENNTKYVVEQYASKIVDEDHFLVEADNYGGNYSVLDNNICLKLNYPDYIITKTDVFEITDLERSNNKSYLKYSRIHDENMYQKLVNELTQSLSVEVDKASPRLKSESENNTDVDVDVDVRVKIK